MRPRLSDNEAVRATGAQHDRFNRRQRLENDVPPIAQWRCNLTALSQIHNLYFVAYGKDIYVYIPEFPSQALPATPALIFTSTPSSPHLSGYLDQRRPHCINNLIVQFLGTEEVVAVVRDDGDVDAFLVRHVVHAIELRGESGSTVGVHGDEIRPFFQSNVGHSAWGLAIHSEARILATSSNAHEVRVFSFGLLDTNDDDNDGGEQDSDHSATPLGANSGRRTDVTHQVINGESNIPYISFCNTGDDPHARWLLTTDISGVCRIMDLHILQAVQAFRFGRSFVDAQSQGFDRFNAGWAIMFLDRRSFTLENSTSSATGADEDDAAAGLKRSDLMWDLGETVKRLPGASEPFMRYTPEESQTSDFVSRRDRGSSVSTEDTSPPPDDPDDTTNLDSNDESDGGAPIDIDIDIEMGSQVDNDEDHEGPEVEVEVSPTPYQSIPGSFPRDNTSGNPEPSIPDPNEPHLIDYDEDFSDSWDDDPWDSIPDGLTISHIKRNLHDHAPRFTHANPLCDGLPCPILHASVRNIYLLQPSHSHPPSQPSSNDSDPASTPPTPGVPVVGLDNPLRQTIHHSLSHLRFFDRLNMNAYIPSLGILVLASQKGRAVVLALTKSTPPSLTSATSRPSRRHERETGGSIYSFRLVAILPFAWQEEKGLRPGMPLLGVAAGPMQGCGRSGAKRWRLMLSYTDFSVLSYELRRPGGVDADGAGEVLVV